MPPKVIQFQRKYCLHFYLITSRLLLFKGIFYFANDFHSLLQKIPLWMKCKTKDDTWLDDLIIHLQIFTNVQFFIQWKSFYSRNDLVNKLMGIAYSKLRNSSFRSVCLSSVSFMMFSDNTFFIYQAKITFLVK